MKIVMSKQFIEMRKVAIEQRENGDTEISIDGDFLVFLNHKNVFAVSTFGKNSKGLPCDTTVPVKDLLVDQLQYVDYLQMGDDCINGIEKKFGPEITKEVHQ